MVNTHGRRSWGTVSFWKAWRWPWSSCSGRHRCLRCSRKTSSRTAWSACVCQSLRCTVFWLCNSSVETRRDMFSCCFGFYLHHHHIHVPVRVTFPSKLSCCISWSLLPMPMKAHGWDSCSEHPSLSICSLFFFHPQPIRYTHGGGQKNLNTETQHKCSGFEPWAVVAVVSDFLIRPLVYYLPSPLDDSTTWVVLQHLTRSGQETTTVEHTKRSRMHTSQHHLITPHPSPLMVSAHVIASACMCIVA